MKVVESKPYGKRGDGRLIRYDDVKPWYSCFYSHGKEIRRSTKTPDLKKARSFHKAKLDEVALDRTGMRPLITPTAARVTVSELLDAYREDCALREIKSLESVVYRMKPLRAHFGSMRAASVTTEAVDRYIRAKQQAGQANGTVNRGPSILAAAFRLGRERKRVTEVPIIRKLKEADPRQGFFESEQLEALLAALPDYLRDMVRFTYLTGWHKGEVVGLRWEWVNLKARTITLPTTKNGRPRTLTLAGDVLEILQRCERGRLVERDGEPVVASHVFHRAGRPIDDFKKAWHTALVKAGLTHQEKVDGTVVTVHDILFHDLRRTAARNMLAAGIRDGVAIQVTGQATRSMFDRYSIVSGDDVKQAMEAVTVDR